MIDCRFRFDAESPARIQSMAEAVQNFTPDAARRRFRFSLRGIVALTTGCAIVLNLALAQPTKEFGSIVRIMIAAGFLVGGATYLAMNCRPTPVWQRWVAVAAWAVAAWGVVIVLCTSSYLIGWTLFKILESP